MTYTSGFRCCHEAPSPALVDSFQERELFVLSSVWLWIQRIQKSDHIILLQSLTRPLLPLRVTAKSEQEALVSQPSLGPPASALLSHAHCWGTGTLQTQGLCFCSLCLECSSSRYPHGFPPNVFPAFAQIPLFK